VDELSTSPCLVPRVKKAVQSLSIPECEELVKEALECEDHLSILNLSEGLAKSRYGDLF